jgi:hypothetical protein
VGLVDLWALNPKEHEHTLTEEREELLNAIAVKHKTQSRVLLSTMLRSPE